MSRIVIDARMSGTGTGRYIDQLVGAIAKQTGGIHEYIVLATHGRLDFMRQLAPNFEVVESGFKEFTFGEQLVFRRQLKSLKADLVHFGMTQQPVLYRGAKVTTVHDLTTLRFRNLDKKRTTFWVKQQIYKWVIRRAVTDSQAVITPSEYVKNALVSFAKVSPEKVTVTYEAAEAIAQSPAPLPDLQNKQFIMYLGRPTQHKNLERLIQAFALLRAQHPDLYLVLAGKKDANYSRIEQQIHAKNILNVVFTDFVSEGQLRWLYENCAAYVFPSLSEGFGLPGLEAMVHGAPVVSSNATCLPEIYGDAAHYFDPLNVQAMAGAINEVLTDKNLREKLIAAGKVRVAQYSWQKTAEETRKVYEKVLSS